MFCQNCGNNVKDNDIYCPYCGSKVERGEGAPEPKPYNPDRPVNEMKWVNPVMITLFIVTLLLWFLGFFLYVTIVALTIKDPLDFTGYIKPWLAIVHLVISILCLSLGIFFKIKKYQTVKNIVAGVLGTLGALIGVIGLALASSTFTKSPKLTATSEYYLDMKVIEPLLPTQFNSKMMMVEATNENGEKENVPIYIYLKFTNNVEITIFETEIQNSSRWTKAEVTKKSIITYDYYLIYNYNNKTFDNTDLEHSFIFYYSQENKSMAIIPGTLLSYLTYLDGVSE